MSKKTQVEIAQNELCQMNLTEDENNPKKKPFVNNSELATQLEMEQTTVYNVRESLKFARANGINENCFVVYAWRWKENDKYTKIGTCPIGNIRMRIITTYEPIDDPLLIGVREFSNKKEAKEYENNILNIRFKSKRTRPDREWIIINETFNEVIDREFTRIGKIVERIEKVV
ncbi:hypothetical protein C6497_07150 [Candidatus Poribacteria bacterium]|nr:MAG: hypothetical protein C6497_07150 [Candidatus Poribacteria bacterium]